MYLQKHLKNYEIGNIRNWNLVGGKKLKISLKVELNNSNKTVFGRDWKIPSDHICLTITQEGWLQFVSITPLDVLTNVAGQQNKIVFQSLSQQAESFKTGIIYFLRCAEPTADPYPKSKNKRIYPLMLTNWRTCIIFPWKNCRCSTYGRSSARSWETTVETQCWAQAWANIFADRQPMLTLSIGIRRSARPWPALVDQQQPTVGDQCWPGHRANGVCLCWAYAPVRNTLPSICQCWYFENKRPLALDLPTDADPVLDLRYLYLETR